MKAVLAALGFPVVFVHALPGVKPRVVRPGLREVQVSHGDANTEVTSVGAASATGRSAVPVGRA